MHVTWNTHFLALVLVLFDIGNYVNIYATLQYSTFPFGIGKRREYISNNMSILDRDKYEYICDNIFGKGNYESIPTSNSMYVYLG